MNNIDKMKNYIINRIKELDYHQFERLVDLINESDDDEVFDKTVLFNCVKCEKAYGNCVCKVYDDKDAVCSERFMKYAMSEETRKEEKVK